MIGSYLLRNYALKIDKETNTVYYDVGEIRDLKQHIDCSVNKAQELLIELIAENFVLAYQLDKGKMLVRKIRDETPDKDLDGRIEQSGNVLPVKMHRAETAIWNPVSKAREVINKEYADLVWEFDLEWMNRLQIPITHGLKALVVPVNHWGIVREMYVMNTIPSLVVLCMRKLASSNLAYGGTKDYPYVHNGSYNSRAVVCNQITRLIKPHVTFNEGYNFNHTYAAVKYYYKYCVRPTVRPFRISATDFKKFDFSATSKAGHYFIKSGHVYEDRDVKVRYTQNPTRQQCNHLELRNLSVIFGRAINCAKKGMVPIQKPLFPGVTTARVKDQFVNLYVEEGTPPEEYSTKGRVFFNPKDLQINRIFKMRHNERTYYPRSFPSPRGERGMFINFRNDIGQKWIYGGAHLKYLSLRGDLGDKYERVITERGDITYKWREAGTQMYGEWDVSAFDLSILSPMLMMYFHSARYWVLEEDNWQFRFFLYMLEYAAEAIASNCVQHFKDFLLVVGMMPSGSSETSHGDTWIMLIFFVLTFIFHVISVVDASVRKEIISNLFDVLIIALAYGDDCNYSYPRKLKDYIGVHPLSQFAASAYGAKLRNVQEHTSLMTYTTYSKSLGVTGFVYKGPIYLKRYYVWDHNFRKKGICQVLPWRATEAYRWRLAMPKKPSGSLIESVPRLIGLVYDTMGVDKTQYRLIKDFYVKVMRELIKKYDLHYLVNEIEKGLKDDDKYFRKVGLNTINSQFPSFKRLYQMHKLDLAKHVPAPHRTWQEWMDDDQWW